MIWAGTTINRWGIPINGRRVNPTFLEDESFYLDYDEDLYWDLV